MQPGVVHYSGAQMAL